MVGRTISRVVVCGGIGSGKSTVGRLLAERGALVIDADAVGHEVLAGDPDVQAAIAERWPEAVVDGVIDRARLAGAVFADPAELEELESITHPAIRRRIMEVAEGAGGVVVVELPVLGKVLGDEWYRVYVDVPVEERMRRLQERGMERADAELRVVAQPEREQWLESADEVVDNSGDPASLVRRVDALWERLGADPGSCSEFVPPAE